MVDVDQNSAVPGGHRYSQAEVAGRGIAGMCRNIKTLFNFEPPATDEEIRAAAIQYVRKVGGYNRPSQVNADIHEAAVEEVVTATRKLLSGLSTTAVPKNRETELLKARARSEKRFANRS